MIGDLKGRIFVNGWKQFWKNEVGAMSLSLVGMYLLFVVALIAAMLQVISYRVVGSRAEDALTAAVLAAEVIDVKQYGFNQEMLIRVSDSFSIYQNALTKNMQLQTTPGGQHYLEAPQMCKYIVYNVRTNGNVEVYDLTSGGSAYVVSRGKGSLRCPDGSVVNQSGIYAQIQIPYKGVWGTRYQVIRDCHVDVASRI